MANKLAIVVGSVALFIIALLLFQGHNLKRQLKESQEDLGACSTLHARLAESLG